MSHLPRGWSQPILTLPCTGGVGEWRNVRGFQDALQQGALLRIARRGGFKVDIPKHEAMEVMGITHDMTCEQIGEAVPPAYAEYVAALVMADNAVRRW